MTILELRSILEHIPIQKLNREVLLSTNDGQRVKIKDVFDESWPDKYTGDKLVIASYEA